MSVRIDVEGVVLTHTASPRASDGLRCSAGISDVKVKTFTYKLDEPQEAEYPKGPDGTNIDDPVLWLQEMGWQSNSNVGSGLGPGGDNEATQPAGFRFMRRFDSLHIEYESPISCTCEGKANFRYLNFKVDYDKSSNKEPKLTVTETDKAGVPLDPQDAQIRPTTRQAPGVNSQGIYTVTVTSTISIPCPCSEQHPCLSLFNLRYLYRPVVLPD